MIPPYPEPHSDPRYAFQYRMIVRGHPIYLEMMGDWLVASYGGRYFDAGYITSRTPGIVWNPPAPAQCPISGYDGCIFAAHKSVMRSPKFRALTSR